MLVDSLNIFAYIKNKVNKEIEISGDCFIHGSRLGEYKGDDYDFDVVVDINGLSREEYILYLPKFNLKFKEIRKYFLQFKDEFGRAIKVDLTTTQEGHKIKKYKKIDTTIKNFKTLIKIDKENGN